MSALAIEAATQIQLRQVAPNLKLTFINEPLPGQTLVMQAHEPFLCLSLSALMGFAVSLYGTMSTGTKLEEAESGLIK